MHRLATCHHRLPASIRRRPPNLQALMSTKIVTEIRSKCFSTFQPNLPQSEAFWGHVSQQCNSSTCRLQRKDLSWKHFNHWPYEETQFTVPGNRWRQSKERSTSTSESSPFPMEEIQHAALSAPAGSLPPSDHSFSSALPEMQSPPWNVNEL